MVRVFYRPDYVGSADHFDTTRKARWIADSLATSPIPGIELVAPRPVTREQVLRVHEEHYVRVVETGIPLRLAESQGLNWDPGLWPMVLASTAAEVLGP
jgi:acetoin utilization deacetylase AcuC-like enzyme